MVPVSENMLVILVSLFTIMSGVCYIFLIKAKSNLFLLLMLFLLNIATIIAVINFQYQEDYRELAGRPIFVPRYVNRTPIFPENEIFEIDGRITHGDGGNTWTARLTDRQMCTRYYMFIDDIRIPSSRVFRVKYFETYSDHDKKTYKECFLWSIPYDK